MSPQTAPTTLDRDDAGVLLVEEQRFSILPEWVLDLEVSDAAIRLYAVLLRYGGNSGTRMPSRRTLAERLHRSVDSIDRAMRELEAVHVVRVEHRRHGSVHLTNRYHLRTSDPTSWPSPAALREGSRTSAATPRKPDQGGRRSAATPGRTVAATLAADLRPDPDVPTETPPPPTPSRRPSVAARAEGVVETNARLLADCGIDDLPSLTTHCSTIRRSLGLPDTRWAGPCLLVAIQVAVKARHWPPALVRPALLAIAADPTTRSPMRLAEAGPWWDHPPTPPAPVGSHARLAELEERLAATDGRRVALQAQARGELRAEGQPVTRLTVARRACELLDQLARA